MAVQPEYSNVQFTSIVLDECDGARNIIEQANEPRWKNMEHFYMDKKFKETAKTALGFNQVPFYVVLNENGEITQKGRKKDIDFDLIPGIVRPEKKVERVNDENIPPIQPKVSEPPVQQMRVFTLDDDF